MKLTRTMLGQLQAYVEDRDRDGYDGGWYYGNKAQFEKRHAAIKEWLAEQLAEMPPLRPKCRCDALNPMLCHECENSTMICKCHDAALDPAQLVQEQREGVRR